MEGSITLAPKFTILKINPIELLTPQEPRGEGIQFCLFGKKNYFKPQNICGKFGDSGLKLTIFKINPIAVLTPPSTKGNVINFHPFGGKILYLAQEHMLKVS